MQIDVVPNQTQLSRAHFLAERSIMFFSDTTSLLWHEQRKCINSTRSPERLGYWTDTKGPTETITAWERMGGCLCVLFLPNLGHAAFV